MLQKRCSAVGLNVGQSGLEILS